MAGILRNSKRGRGQHHVGSGIQDRAQGATVFGADRLGEFSGEIRGGTQDRPIDRAGHRFGIKTYSTMTAEKGPYPYDTEALYAPEIVSDFELGGGKTQTSNVGIFKADIGLVDCIGIARNNGIAPPSTALRDASAG
jgi:hypothetical protein